MKNDWRTGYTDEYIYKILIIKFIHSRIRVFVVIATR